MYIGYDSSLRTQNFPWKGRAKKYLMFTGYLFGITENSKLYRVDGFNTDKVQ